MSYIVEATVALIRVSIAAALIAKPPNPQMPRIDPFGVHVVARREVIDRGAEILGIDVGRSDVTGFAAAFAGVGRVEGDGEESPFGQRLGIEARGLLFHGAERTADGDGGQFPGGVPGDVEIGCERNAVAVAESHFRVVHSVALREHLVPLAGQIRVLFHGRIGVIALSEAGERTGRKQGRRQDQGSFHRAFVLVYDAKVRSRCEPALTRIADMPTRITDSDRPTWA